MARKRSFQTKRMAGKGEKKLLPCLGEGCNKKFLTTIDTRFCPKCRKLRNQETEIWVFEFTFESSGRDE